MPIAQQQAIQWMIADNYTRLDAARLLLLRAAFLKDQRRAMPRKPPWAGLRNRGGEQGLLRCHADARGYGYTQDFPIERYARDVRITTIYEGTSEIQRLIISRDLPNQARLRPRYGFTGLCSTGEPDSRLSAVFQLLPTLRKDSHQGPLAKPETFCRYWRRTWRYG